ncbi:UDP-N-acetylmuramoyl-tripeptide--D-alanyl-D-alanine ligase [Candidatus Erwinia haradaeae]|uniref:UDP-N-acetylmuramoyl-tripeptide--D-alanyl-D-alanine ligase n=1 Tax=Candidatus Erwinia haradaeae TaxID=1922217 RepID=A0A451DMJ3_9GAMM|nr:UDP-N-acetylmuramoyl-tripeptide--D-alanyl-D-alanine ligase [Candidatus Erwinia haradaeae]VFP87969.1 UDP-N-acetylmuramoyl-tripeptide--D-alanyl-D-alanine ligase [Candidatus Erwinia haradaeae]
MIPITLKKVAEITGGILYGANITISDISTDTRQLRTGNFFVALQGKYYDAHDFAWFAIKAGCSGLLVSKYLHFNTPCVVVKNTRVALGKLAAWVRQQSNARVVAITGSSGKTSVKDMTDAILCHCGQTLSTVGTLNNDIGVPITLLGLHSRHKYIVVELGASHIGEIAYTVQLAQPESVLINNLSTAHLEGFGSLSGLAKAKGEILNHLPIHGTAIINNDSHDLENWRHAIKGRALWRFSIHKKSTSDFYASDISCNTSGTLFNLHSPQGSIAISLPLHGDHQIANALAASALALSIGAPLHAIPKGLCHMKEISGRLFPIYFNKNKLLIDDSYNSNMGSMIAAIKVLSERPGYRVMIVGDMAEMGKYAIKYHSQVGDLIHSSGINKVLSIGSLGMLIARKSTVGEYFKEHKELGNRAHELLMQHQCITLLVKGSRSLCMEKIVNILQEKGVC